MRCSGVHLPRNKSFFILLDTGRYVTLSRVLSPGQTCKHLRFMHFAFCSLILVFSQHSCFSKKTQNRSCCCCVRLILQQSWQEKKICDTRVVTPGTWTLEHTGDLGLTIMITDLMQHLNNRYEATVCMRLHKQA